MVVLFDGDEVMNLIGRKSVEKKSPESKQNPSVSIQLPSYHHQLAIRSGIPGSKLLRRCWNLCLEDFKNEAIFHRAMEGSS